MTDAEGPPKMSKLGGDLEDVFLSHLDGNEKDSQAPWSAPKANPRVAQQRKAARRMGPNTSLAIMVLMPFAYFFASLLLFSFHYHGHEFEVYVWVGAGLMVALLTTIADAEGNSGGWHLYLGSLCIFGLIAGSVTGLYNYQANTFRYWAFEEYRAYTNVLPSELATAHLDAGWIRFAMEARVDTTRTVGFKAGHVFCVAPIIDDSGPGTPIEYWAAGRDCCQKRSKFKCDDVWSAVAKSGVVMREAGGLVPSDRNFYMKAVREASTTYDVVSAQNPLFVSWVTDPNARHQEFWEEAKHMILMASLVYGVVSLIFGFVMTYASKSARRKGAGRS